MKSNMSKSFLVIGVAGLATLFATNAMAFSIGLKLGDVLERHQEMDDPGLSWWSAFQNRFPRARLPNRDTLGDRDERPIGDWFRMERTGASRAELPDRFDMALVGIDRETRLKYFKQQIFRKVLVSRRLNHWLSRQAAAEATPVPLPAPLLLLGSAFASLFAFRRRALRGS